MDNAQTYAGERKADITTSQTMAQFYAEAEKQVLGESNDAEIDKPEPVKSEPDASVDAHAKEAEAADPDEHEEIKEARKGNKKLDERFSELTAKRKEAEKAAKEAADAREAERVARQQAEIERDALRAKYEPPKTELAPKPVRENYVDDATYEKDMEEWATEKVQFEFTKKRAAEAAKAHADQVEKSWRDGVEAAKKDIPDYADVVSASKVMLSNEAVTAVREDSNGALIIYHLAQNPDIAEKLSKMSVPAMNREVGRLSAKLDKPEVKQVATTKIADITQVAQAPAPISPARGTASGSASYDTSKMPYATYKALRDAGKIK